MAIVALGLTASACTHRSAEAAAPAATVPAAPSTPAQTGKRIIRATGVVQAVRSYTVRVPQLAQTSGQNNRLTLTALVPNGTPVKKGDILVEFDPTAQLDEAREAKAKLADLHHQLEEKRALVNSELSKRLALIKEAETELGKAQLQLRKGPVLPELERQKAEVKAAAASDRLASLHLSHKHRLEAEAASVKVLELKNERQKVVVERLQSNLEKLTIRAPHDGMTALESVWRSGSMGPSQVGDQVWPNQPIVRIFDPTEMIVDTQINESDMVALAISTPAKVYIDAYPNAAFEAQLESASPVATAGLESPVKSFTARFRILQRDNRILPDLSGSLEIAVNASGGGKS
jgi:multidrug efflux pump subunit AcrA (membrane-fusion protein)